MSDPAQHEELPEIQEEESRGTSLSPSPPGLTHPLTDAHPRHAPHHSPAIPPPRPRRGSSVSHVDIGYFDPEGVRELRRTISQMSRNTGHQLGPENVEHPPMPTVDKHASSASSSTVLDPREDPFDLEKTLRGFMRNKEDSSIQHRELGVYFKDLRVQGLGASATYQPTVGSLVNPLAIFENIRKARHPPVRDILSDFEGVVRPGEMLLVLGRPGSGCTTLLKTLANQRKEYHSISGDVHYDSLSPDDIAKHFRGDVQYCPEDDVHFPMLSVGQTISFAAKSRAPQTRVEGTRAEFVQSISNVLLTIFGLKHVVNTPVGDAAIRGVSGGEKKRVSISEALATRSCINCWDNSTRGLDASTALEFVQALRIATDVNHLSTVVSIYQAGESLYKLFDKVCLMYEGRMAYYGPADQARQYFIDMGYEPANRQTTADFLVSVTDPKARIPRSSLAKGVIPRTPAEFAAHYTRSAIANTNRADMDDYRGTFVGQSKRASAYIESAQAERAKNAHMRSAYTISVPMQVRAVMLRRMQILRGSAGAQLTQLVAFMIQGIIVGTIFLRAPESTSAYFSRGGVLFFALLFTALTSMAEIPALYIQRPIVSRHQKAALYHPFIEAAALTLVDIPIAFATIAVFSIIIYFLVGLQQSAGQFFIFLLFVFAMSLTMKSWFRTLAAVFPSSAAAQAVAGVALLVMVLYTGYMIPKPSMIGALRWLTYINPLRYGFEALISNEFHTLQGSCATLVPSGPGYEDVSTSNQVCTTVGSQPGQPFVDGNRFIQLSFGFSYSNLWRNFGIVVAFGVGFLAFLLIASEYNTGVAGESAVTLFKRGSKSSAVEEAEIGLDEEKAGGEGFSPGDEDIKKNNKEIAQAVAEQPAMTNVFSWDRIQYSVPVQGGGQRKLLDNVSGYVAPGKLTALMGESGAGKTTLLNVLAQRTTTGVITGDRFVNGQALPKDFQAQTGYCQQMDTHLPTATVREALTFSAKLRQPSSVPDSEKEAYVETCLKMCGLEAWADASVGSLGIEHRKRTTIGVELAAKPKLLLFLDEPTSGLDSQSAWAIMAFLRTLADNGQAILCTIHQPSAELFQVFDRLLLLKKGGQTVYFGDLGKNSTTLLRYFETNGSRKCQPDENPAEFILEVIGAGATATIDQDWHETWLQSPEAAEAQRRVDDIHTEGIKRPPVQVKVKSQYASSWGYQVLQLTKRGFVDHWRNPSYIMAKMMLNITSGLLIGFTFFKAKSTLQGTQNKLFAIFISTILSAPLSNQLQVPFLDMRSIYEIRERPSRMYNWAALVASQILAEAPWNIFGSSIYFLCWYFTVGFLSDRAGYTYLMLGVLFPIYYTTIAQAIAAMSANAEIAAILFSLLFSFVISFNGVLQPFSQLGWWQWMYHVSPYTYLIGGLLGQAIGKQEVTCSPIEYVTLTPPAGRTCGEFLQSFISIQGGYLLDPNATQSCQFCSSRTTDELMGPRFNIFYSQHWRNLGIFCAFIVFNIFAVFFLTYVFRIRSGSLLGGLKGMRRRTT